MRSMVWYRDSRDWRLKGMALPPKEGARGATRLDVEGVAQELRRGPRAPGPEMLDVLTAGDAGGDHSRVSGRRLHRGGEAPATQRHRDVVVLLLEAEGARHAAAAGIDFAHLVARPAEGGHRWRGADHGLLV